MEKSARIIGIAIASAIIAVWAFEFIKYVTDEEMNLPTLIIAIFSALLFLALFVEFLMAKTRGPLKSSADRARILTAFFCSALALAAVGYLITEFEFNMLWITIGSLLIASAVQLLLARKATAAK